MASPPPLSDNALGLELVKSQWIEFAIVTLVMVARLYTRLIVKRIFGPDDYLMVTAYLVTLCAFILNNLAVNAGFGQHATVLDPPLVSEAVKWAFLAQIFGILGSAFARMAFIATLTSFLCSTQRLQLWLLRVFFFFQVTVNLMTVLYILLQCRPSKGLWDHSINAKCLPPSIQSNIGYFQGSISAITDLSLAIFPATVIWKLNMKTSLKLSLCASMGLGIFAFVAAVTKTIFLRDISLVPTDLTWALFKIQFWFCIENSLLIIAATIPVLRPLLNRYRKRSLDTADNRDGDGEGGGDNDGLGQSPVRGTSGSILGFLQDRQLRGSETTDPDIDLDFEFEPKTESKDFIEHKEDTKRPHYQTEIVQGTGSSNSSTT